MLDDWCNICRLHFARHTDTSLMTPLLWRRYQTTRQVQLPTLLLQLTRPRSCQATAVEIELFTVVLVIVLDEPPLTAPETKTC